MRASVIRGYACVRGGKFRCVGLLTQERALPSEGACRPEESPEVAGVLDAVRNDDATQPSNSGLEGMRRAHEERGAAKNKASTARGQYSMRGGGKAAAERRRDTTCLGRKISAETCLPLALSTPGNSKLASSRRRVKKHSFCRKKEREPRTQTEIRSTMEISTHLRCA